MNCKNFLAFLIVFLLGMMHASSSLADSTDHEQIVGAWGFQLMSRQPNFGAPTSVTAALTLSPTIGVRKWMGIDRGWDAGVTFGLRNANDTTDIGLGGEFGWLMGLSHYKHLNVFFEPSGGLFIFAPDQGDTAFELRVNASLGAEIQLGMFDLSRVALTTRVTAGMNILNDGKTTTIGLGTLGGTNNSIWNMLTGNIGFVIFI